ncbi:hypothetical protein GGQ92_000409 [Gracilibacillus halotolerans]|uniref:DUF2487 domain-containing protein n=1 Tax=Gracilibacillus halotolerans TaxID=74386 RepID=A0A841RHY3_9BACI|nr:DUF2487 family protein [Gracilibacillus halotolerans]MBB6511642.1 hypothetical protein [Gracilibacillus halotolerans]
MQWHPDDLQGFFKAKEYIDTVILPITSISFKNQAEAEKLAIQKKSIEIITQELERNYAGRIFVCPIYIYQHAVDREQEIARLNSWTEEMLAEQFEHRFIISHDILWKKYEKQFDSHFIWTPSFSMSNFQSDDARLFVKEQTNELSELIRSYW